MSNIKFTLTKQHIAVVQKTNLPLYYGWRGMTDEHEYKEEVYNEFGLILYGKPDSEFDPMADEAITWSDEQKVEMDKLFEEFDTALQIMLHTGTFDEGNYKTRHHDINWKIN
jgi:hypothetical protein